MAVRLVVACVGLAAATGAFAQGSTPPSTPAVRRATEIWNTTGTDRTNGAYDLAAGKASSGNVAVLNGPVTISGTVHGSLVAINADVRLRAGARIDRDLIVVGGTLTGADSASLGGETLQQLELLRYRLDNDVLQPDGEPVYDDTWWRRARFKHDWSVGTGYSDFLYVASRTYNRVEGWSFVAGPRVHRPTSWGAVNFELFAVGRTAKPLRWDDESIGHDAKIELLFGKPIGVALGGRAFDIVAPTEDWQLGDGEVGFASALLQRDFRDYYVRHGGAVFTRLVAGKDADVTVSLSDEQWANREARDPWSAALSTNDWRPNPKFDGGPVHLLTTRLHIDTRDREASSLGGWYVNAEFEQGGGRITRFGAPIVTFAAPSPEDVWYSRGFIDLRRYNRVAPGMSLDLRVVAGGWLAGDPLPTQRRLSVGGPGTLPGYGFREVDSGMDILNCTTTITQIGTPAQCDRIGLAQAQLRSNFLFDSWRSDRHADWWRPGFNHRTSWVLFADAGRGWMVNRDATPATDPLYFGRNTLPPLQSFKVDIGGGIDFGDFGAYWAKAMNNGSSEPIRFILRLQHRI